MHYNENFLTDKKGNVIIKSYFSSVPPCTREWRNHYHAECELSTFLKGSGIYKTLEHAYPFQPGDVFVFRANEVHSITEIHSEICLLNLRFMPGVLLSEGGDLELLKIFFARSQSFQNRIDPNNPQTQILHSKIVEIANELERKQDGYTVLARYLLFSAFVSLIRDYDYIDRSAAYPMHNNAIESIARATIYINENLCDPITLDEIAGQVAMTPTYFSTVFKKINGISPWQYITIKRVEEAIRLLKTTDTKVLDIALQCGFGSSSNFYKEFISITGKKPKAYRQKTK